MGSFAHGYAAGVFRPEGAQSDKKQIVQHWMWPGVIKARREAGPRAEHATQTRRNTIFPRG